MSWADEGDVVYIDNEPYDFDTAANAYRSRTAWSPREVTMAALRSGKGFLSLFPVYVVGSVPSSFDDRRNALVRVSNPQACLGAREYSALLRLGAVEYPQGERFKLLMEKERAVRRRNDGERDR